MTKLFTLLLLSILLVACKNGKQQSDSVVLDIHRQLFVKKSTLSALNEIAEDVKIIPVETNESCLFDFLAIAGTTDDNIISFDKDAVYSIHKSDGEVTPVLKKKGRGPQEYKVIMDVVLEGDSIINIYDNGKRGFLKYDSQGNFLDFLANDSVGTFRRMPDGNLCIITSPFHNNDFFTAICDGKWDFIREGVPNDRKDVDFDMFFFNDFRFYNEKMLFRDYFGDTIYHITSEKDTPYIVLSQGQYKMPFDIAADNFKRNDEGYKYIDGINYMISSTYCFLNYYFDKKQYFDIWDLSQAKLIYRNTNSFEKPSYGIPVKLHNGLVVSVWANFAKDNYVYCVIEPTDAVKIIPSLPEDTNPIILEIKLK